MQEDNMNAVELNHKNYETHYYVKELERQNKLLKDRLTKYEEDGDVQIALFSDVNRLEEENKELKEKVGMLENKLQLRMATNLESNAYWDEIFTEDYPFNKENAYKELSDYYFVLEQLPTIYMDITGGRLSKTTYFASSVIEAHNDEISIYENRVDDLEYTLKCALEDLQKILENPSTTKETIDILISEIKEILEKTYDEYFKEPEK